MCLQSTNIRTFLLIAYRALAHVEDEREPTVLARSHRVDSLRWQRSQHSLRHMSIVSSLGVRGFDHFCRESFEHVASSFNPAESVLILQDLHTLPGKRLAEHAAVMCSSGTPNEFWSAGPTAPPGTKATRHA